MLNQPEQNIAIEQLRLNCNTGQRAMVLDSLDAANWPKTRSDEIIVLRRLEIEGSAWMIGENAADQVAKLIHTSGNPWANSQALSHALKFSCRAEYIACLCSAIASNRQTVSWVWLSEQKRLSSFRSKAESLLSVFSEEINLLPDIFHYLEKHQSIAITLKKMGDVAVNTLIEHVIRSHGLNIKLSDHYQEFPSDLNDAWSSSLVQSITTGIQTTEWDKSLRAPDRKLSEASTALFSLLLLWRSAPHHLPSPLANALFHRVRFQLSPNNNRPSANTPKKVSGSPATFHPQRKLALIAIGDHPVKPPASRPEESYSDSSVLPQGETPAQQDPSFNSARAESNIAIQPTIEQQFLTRSGGFFFLINLFRSARSQTLLSESQASPWLHLFQLCQLNNVVLDKPLQHFITEKLQLKSPHALQKLAATEYDHTLFRLSQKRFSHHRFWLQELINRLARVRYTTASLNIDFDVSAIDLDIRLSGLDIDPTWLPWLGTIVRFHYLDDPVLRPGNPE